MQLASSAVAVFARQAITTAGNHFVQPPPQRHYERQVHRRSQPPQARQIAAEESHRVSTAKFLLIGCDDPHLLHQLFEGQVRIAFRNARVVKAQISQSSPGVEAAQSFYLSAAKIALSIPNDDRRAGRIVWIAKILKCVVESHRAVYLGGLRKAGLRLLTRLTWILHANFDGQPMGVSPG